MYPNFWPFVIPSMCSLIRARLARWRSRKLKLCNSRLSSVLTVGFVSLDLFSTSVFSVPSGADWSDWDSLISSTTSVLTASDSSTVDFDSSCLLMFMLVPCIKEIPPRNKTFYYINIEAVQEEVQNCEINITHLKTIYFSNNLHYYIGMWNATK